MARNFNFYKKKATLRPLGLIYFFRLRGFLTTRRRARQRTAESGGFGKAALYLDRKTVFAVFLATLFLPPPLFAEDAPPPVEAAAAVHAAAVDPQAFPRPLRGKAAVIPERFVKSAAQVASPSLIGGLEKSATRHYIERYTTRSGKLWLNGIMANAQPYLAFIRREIDARDLPRELLYLPVIESGFVNRARSSAGAVGLWQFMRNSIGPFDMKITDWMDERMDFWKSTIGALRKLQENHYVLGDWALALAAYNMGLGGVQRIIRRTGVKDYWKLSEQNHLRIETSVYMPKLLAVSYILTHLRQFGLPVIWTKDVQWTRIKAGKTIDLRLLAEYAGVDEKILINANQELFYTVTPPDENYYLKVRSEDADKIAATLERSDVIMIKYYMYTVKSGDTLFALAKHYGVTLAQIMEHNKGVQPKTLQIGMKLVIPAFKDVAPYKGAIANDPPPTDFTGVHVVQRGETLWSIARVYNIRPETLAVINNMDLQDTLSIGKTLKAPIKK
ncbi:MAG: LysM peptidoglycan-binding domain-containing protein [Treponema sp.]|jgi:membrane-bound lytic murein transglycosylase D|nr:LysM peptidoglycan-binding domain-containing protein [Treponema sp.]